MAWFFGHHIHQWLILASGVKIPYNMLHDLMTTIRGCAGLGPPHHITTAEVSRPTGYRWAGGGPPPGGLELVSDLSPDPDLTHGRMTASTNSVINNTDIKYLQFRNNLQQ